MDVKKSWIKFGCLLLTVLINYLPLQAQEILAKVEVDHRRVQGTNTSVFETLETSLNDFVNNQRWTNDAYESKERIECNFFINIASKTDDTYTASLTVSARRPIYNASINTTLLNLVDNDFSFTYKEFDPLVFNKNVLTQDLTAIIGFYVYTIIGLDNDSFKKLGGTPYFSSAMTIASTAQSASGLISSGWDRLGSNQNRHLLISQLTSPEFRALREYSYNYHRLGLDIMYEDVDKGAKVITDGLSTLEKTASTSFASYSMQLFFDVKTDEIQSILKEMDPEEDKETKAALVTTLKKLDPSRVQVYNKLLK